MFSLAKPFVALTSGKTFKTSREVLSLLIGTIIIPNPTVATIIPLALISRQLSLLDLKTPHHLPLRGEDLLDIKTPTHIPIRECLFSLLDSQSPLNVSIIVFLLISHHTILHGVGPSDRFWRGKKTSEKKKNVRPSFETIHTKKCGRAEKEKKKVSEMQFVLPHFFVHKIKATMLHTKKEQEQTEEEEGGEEEE